MKNISLAILSLCLILSTNTLFSKDTFVENTIARLNNYKKELQNEIKPFLNCLRHKQDCTLQQKKIITITLAITGILIVLTVTGIYIYRTKKHPKVSESKPSSTIPFKQSIKKIHFKPSYISVGPFFIEEKGKSTNGIHGWLKANDNDNEAVYALITKENNCYIVTYIDPQFYQELPKGLFVWRSSQDEKESWHVSEQSLLIEQTPQGTAYHLVGNNYIDGEGKKYDPSLNPFTELHPTDYLKTILESYTNQWCPPETIAASVNKQQKQVTSYLDNPNNITTLSIYQVPDQWKKGFMTLITPDQYNYFMNSFESHLKNSGFSKEEIKEMGEIYLWYELHWNLFELNKEINRSVFNTIVDNLSSHSVVPKDQRSGSCAEPLKNTAYKPWSYLSCINNFIGE